MIFAVRLMRQGGRRLSWRDISNSTPYIGDIVTVTGSSQDGGYKFARLLPPGGIGSVPIPHLYEPVLASIAPIALVLRGFERIEDRSGSYSVIQEWYCELKNQDEYQNHHYRQHPACSDELHSSRDSEG